MIYKKEVYEIDGYVVKPLAIIPELDLEIYSRPIACRMSEDGKLLSLQDEDYEVLFKYFAR